MNAWPDVFMGRVIGVCGLGVLAYIIAVAYKVACALGGL